MPPIFSGGDDTDSDENRGLLNRAATAYTRRVPESVQVSVGLPVTAVARNFDENPGATVRPPEAGPTDAYGDRRGPIDTFWDTTLERDSSDTHDGSEFEDDTDLAGPSTGDFARDPSGGTAQLLCESFQFARGNFQVHGDGGDEPDNSGGRAVGGLLLLLAAVLAVVYVVGQLFTFEVGS
jgi:hypothetical protein